MGGYPPVPIGGGVVEQPAELSDKQIKGRDRLREKPIMSENIKSGRGRKMGKVDR